MSEIAVLAAGSLRAVWPELVAAFTNKSGDIITTQFGPAGLLLQRIEQGERCDLFASANLAHPQKLLASGKARSTAVFTSNLLCLSLTPTLAQQEREWLDLLLDPHLRLATSTPLCDPSGDYTWQLFDNIEAHYSGKGDELKTRARQLVGGPKSVVIPENQLAASWLLSSGQADLFIGYQSYAARLKATGNVVTLAIPPAWQTQARYAYAVCSKQAEDLGTFLLSNEAKAILRRAGFDH